MKTVTRNVETDAMITILNHWRDGNKSGELKTDAFELLNKWVGPQKCLDVMRNVNSLIQACRNKSLAEDYILSVVDKVYAMLDYLCHCDDPELEYAGRYARKKTFGAMGIVLDY